MFAVDDVTAEATRRAFDKGGELSGMAELRRHFPLITDNTQARLCVRAIARWKPLPLKQPRGRNQPAAVTNLVISLARPAELHQAHRICHECVLVVLAFCATSGLCAATRSWAQ